MYFLISGENFIYVSLIKKRHFGTPKKVKTAFVPKVKNPSVGTGKWHPAGSTGFFRTGPDRDAEKAAQRRVHGTPKAPTPTQIRKHLLQCTRV